MTTTDICFDDLCDRPTVRVSLFERVVRAMDRLSEWHKRAVERRELLEMPEHLLKDIGISRLDAYREYRKPFWHK
ncbi:MAG: DUF1127 domain-containing protein [Arenicellales bacterium]